MIAIAKQPRRKTTNTAWHHGFLQMMPAICRHAQHAFCYRSPEERDDAIQEVLANAMLAYLRLFELGKIEIAYPSVLARHGVARYCAGRRVGTRTNCRDVTSGYAQHQKKIEVERLDCFNEMECEWQNLLIEDKQAGPAETAAMRIDFADWLAQLSRRFRRIAKTLAVGETTGATARKFRVSPGRISQIRGQLRRSWLEFQREATPDDLRCAGA